MTDVPVGTNDDVYPANKLDFATPVSNGVEYEFASEYKLNGPVEEPAVVNVINTVILWFIKELLL
jgi:hypothetical protein